MDPIPNPLPVARPRQPHSFQAVRQVIKGAPPVRMRIALCHPGDRNTAECLWLATHSCQLAFKATDVARGRLNPRVLAQAMPASIIEQILRINLLLAYHEQCGGEVAQLFPPNLPIQLQGLHGVLTHPDSFDACVSMRIGHERHFANVVLALTGSRWMCTALQLA